MAELKTILMPLAIADHAEDSLQMAFTLAAEHQAFLQILHIRPEASDVLPLMGEGMSGAMIGEITATLDQQSRDEALAIRKIFDSVTIRHAAVACEWIEVSGHEEDHVLPRARLADLVILGPFSLMPVTRSSSTLHPLLMGGGSPVLVLPNPPIGTIGHRPLIGWNSSAEAAKTLKAALPLLRKAACNPVIVHIIEEDDMPEEQEIAKPLLDYLTRHGVQADFRAIADGGEDAAGLLLQQAERHQADLLILGAYGHSRIRQMILGGVSQAVLQQTRFPVFFCH